MRVNFKLRAILRERERESSHRDALSWQRAETRPRKDDNLL